jgi:hypothetical protein
LVEMAKTSRKLVHPRRTRVTVRRTHLLLQNEATDNTGCAQAAKASNASASERILGHLWPVSYT